MSETLQERREREKKERILRTEKAYGLATRQSDGWELEWTLGDLLQASAQLSNLAKKAEAHFSHLEDGMPADIALMVKTSKKAYNTVLNCYGRALAWRKSRLNVPQGS